MKSRPAIEGGTPVRTRVFPHIGIPEGRDLGEEEKQLLAQVIDSGHLNRLGGLRMVERFESEFAALHRVPHAHAVTSGTASLHTAVAALDLEPGDEIITTPITDMGTAIAILMQQCIPIFADVDPHTGNITADTIASHITDRTRAILVVHLFGSPADLAPILDLARRHNLAVIEDAAQAHLAEYHGRLVGTLGDIGCFSLQQSKQITTGDGGVLITSNPDYHRRAALFTDKAWPRTGIGQERGHLFLGVNYRMNELTGAVALAQVRKLPVLVERRRVTAEWLVSQLESVPAFRPTPVLHLCRSSWWLFTFTLDRSRISVTPARFAEALTAEGIPARCGYIPMPLFEYSVIRERKTFGTSGLPWTLPQARKPISYDIADYPGTRTALGEILVIGWCEGITRADAEDVRDAIAKLAGFYSED